jgi:hypothetical protein
MTTAYYIAYGLVFALFIFIIILGKLPTDNKK